MCLAIPAQITEHDKEKQLAKVTVMGVEREISTRLTPDAQVGEYILMHAGFSIEVITEDAAKETLDLLKEIDEIQQMQEGLV